MTKGIFFVTLAMIISFSSCKKKDEPKPVVIVGVVKSVTQNASGYTSNYSYDGEGRLAGIVNSDGTSMSVYYGGDTVIETNLDPAGAVVSVNTLFLNSSGVATGSYIRDAGGNVFTHKEYFYDGNNYKTSQKDFDAFNNLIAHKEWGILDGDIYYYTTGDTLVTQNSATLSYSFYYELTNSVGNENRGQKYYGPSTKHAVKTQVKTSNSSGNSRYTYQYTYDNSGRIAAANVYDHLSQLVMSESYTYY